MNLLILYAQIYSFSLFLQHLIFILFCKKEQKNQLPTFSQPFFFFAFVAVIF